MYKKDLIWTPRSLAILYAGFISIFSLGVFSGGYSPLETFVALIIHLIPTFLIIITLLIAWKWPRSGGLLFIIYGIIYAYIMPADMPFTTYLIVAGPLFLIGALFLFIKLVPDAFVKN